MSCTVSSHVLNTVLGTGGRGMKITLEEDEKADGSTWKKLHSGVADNNGRVPGTEFPKIEAGRTYRMTFDTKAYFEQEGVTEYFFPVVRIEFRTKNVVRSRPGGATALPCALTAMQGNYHIPLLISPFGYSTYRGN